MSYVRARERSKRCNWNAAYSDHGGTDASLQRCIFHYWNHASQHAGQRRHPCPHLARFGFAFLWY
eukprot:11201854-Lingulodinium_polyedra.AAC.1